MNTFVVHEYEKLAKKIVLRTNQNMKLENQGIGDDKINISNYCPSITVVLGGQSSQWADQKRADSTL